MGSVDTAIENRALAAVKVLSDLTAVRAAYVFGSHVEGTPDQWSDIDVGVFMEGIENWDDLDPHFYEAVEAAFLALIKSCI